MSSIPHHLAHVDEHVRLKTDVPNLGLHCGEEGLVCSTWFSPSVVFEVEFRQPEAKDGVRVLLWQNDIEAEGQPEVESVKYVEQSCSP